MNDKLKPCPFCQGEAELDMLVSIISCKKCYVQIGDIDYTEEKAIKAWNKREPADKDTT